VAATPIKFRADSAQPFDARCLSWQIPEAAGAREATVSIWTTYGRRKGVRMLAAPHDLVMLRTRPIGCRFVGHADHNAALNIAARGIKRWGEVMRPHAASTLTAS
jgi:hypothetical protein